MRKLKKLLNLSPADILLLVRVAGLLVIVGLGLRLLPCRMLQASLAGRRLRRQTSQTAEGRSVDRLVWAVEVAGRYVGANCLKKALTLQRLLSRRGFSTRLWLGVQPGKATFRAHAWVEYNECVILGGLMGERYTPLHCFDGGDTLAKSIADM